MFCVFVDFLKINGMYFSNVNEKISYHGYTNKQIRKNCRITGRRKE